MNKFFLKLVMLPSGAWRGMGANVEQLKAILSVRLILDDRKPLNFGRQQREQKKPRKYTSIIGMIVSAFVGCIYIFPLMMFSDRIFSLFIYFSMFLFLLTFSLITDFSNVMMDTRDKYIIMPRPVNDRTLFLARLLHVFIYLFRTVLPMSLAGWIYLGIADGWRSAVLFPLPLLLMVFMALFLVHACYLLILRLTKPERFKDVMGYFQIAFSIVVFVMYYGMTTVMKNIDPTINALQFPWVRWLPSYWLAAFWSWIVKTPVLQGTEMLSIVALVAPLLCLWVTVKFLAPRFISGLAALDGAEGSETQAAAITVKRNSGKLPLYQKLATALNRTDMARAGFMMAWLQTARSRVFKMRIYPTFAYVPVYFAFLVFSGSDSFTDTWNALPDSRMYLGLLYITSFVMMQAVSYVTMSEQYKASWIYYSSPVSTPGRIMAGAYKAIWVKYFLPFFICIAAFVVGVWGPGKLLDVLLALINITLFSVCIVRISYRYFPFSMMEQMNNAGTRTIIRVLLTFLIMGILGFGHFMAVSFVWMKLVFILLSSIFLWLVWDSYANTNWAQLKTAQANENL